MSIVSKKLAITEHRWQITKGAASADFGSFGPAAKGLLDMAASANESARRGREAEMRAHMAGTIAAPKPGAGVGFSEGVGSGPKGA
jgi:hypothetical protein